MPMVGGSKTPPKPSLRHRNSLKPFLEAEGENEGDKEEWEKSLQDERDREELDLQRQDSGKVSRSPESVGS
jgi:hypothetical protein